jgi:hypothetical protein
MRLTFSLPYLKENYKGSIVAFTRTLLFVVSQFGVKQVTELSN